MSWQAVVPASYALGESPFWHPQEQALYWVDIVGRQVVRANACGAGIEAWDMPSEPGCIAPAARGGLVIALRHGIFRAQRWGGTLVPLVTLDYDATTVRANDGKCDALGRLWVGSYDETKTEHAAALYCIDCRGGRTPVVECKVQAALTGNALAWSPDSRTLYWSDTASHCVRAWDFDLVSSRLCRPRSYLQFAAKPLGWSAAQGIQPGASGSPVYGGRPDGAAVDVQGNYYVALYEGQRVCQFAPDGTLLADLPAPVPCPTMPCLGGEDLRTLYLTSARHGGATSQTDASMRPGGVFATRVSVPGLPVNFFVE
jgi:sugar lactone lactonase YvrE